MQTYHDIKSRKGMWEGPFGFELHETPHACLRALVLLSHSEFPGFSLIACNLPCHTLPFSVMHNHIFSRSSIYRDIPVHSNSRLRGKLLGTVPLEACAPIIICMHNCPAFIARAVPLNL
jgi:hypothetical protein